MLLLTFNCSVLPAKTTLNNSKLFLVGGGLKTCSSMAPKNCTQQSLFNETSWKNAKKNAIYSINDNTIKLLSNTWPKKFGSANKKNIIKILTTIKKSEVSEDVTPSKLKALFKQYDHHNIINKLNDAEYYLMLDILEQPVFAKDGKTRLQERVELNNSSHLFSTEIYKTFVNLTKNISSSDKPKILVLTASARDPFEAVDFYVAVFTQAGANTTWLPLDATLNNLLQQPDERQQVCQQLSATRLTIQGSINREFVYPDLAEQQLQACLSPDEMLSELSSADGIFINGGDQSLTLKALVNKDGTDSKALKIIKQKLATSSLVIGGTSAGTAVMSGGIFNKSPIVMITNGQSNTAVVRGAKKDVLPMEGCQKSGRCSQDLLNDDLTYRSSGGLGLFHWGILDTHFSERGRQGRLAKLALDTNTLFAFGVDEATALVVDNINGEQIELSVVGQSGVFIIENSLNTTKKEAVLSHYITRDDKITLSHNTLKFELPSWKTLQSDSAELPSQVPEIFKGKRYQQTTELLCRTNNLEISASSSWNNKTKPISIKKLDNAVSRYGVISWDNITKGYCSYQNYRLSL